jgi:hypothetical protein
LQANRKNGEFENSEIGASDREKHSGGREKYPNLEKPSKDRPEQEAPKCKDGHATSLHVTESFIATIFIWCQASTALSRTSN